MAALRTLALSLAGCLAAAVAAPSAATTVRSLSVRDLALGAALVFEGRALAREARADGGAIRTCVRFEVLEVLLGPPVASPLELCFAGGTLAGRTRRVEGMRVPPPGERGIYFAKPLGEAHVHPLLGWDQGRFLVREGPEPAVTTASGDPVAALEPERAPRAEGPSRGVARGALLAPRGGRALSPTEFKERVRALAAEAGRR
jgi:hypothetical protein